MSDSKAPTTLMPTDCSVLGIPSHNPHSRKSHFMELNLEYLAIMLHMIKAEKNKTKSNRKYNCQI